MRPNRVILASKWYLGPGLESTEITADTHNSPALSPPKSAGGKDPGALTGAARAAAERVRRAVGLGHVVVDVPDRGGQSVASRARTCEEEQEGGGKGG